MMMNLQRFLAYELDYSIAKQKNVAPHEIKTYNLPCLKRQKRRNTQVVEGAGLESS